MRKSHDLKRRVSGPSYERFREEADNCLKTTLLSTLKSTSGVLSATDRAPSEKLLRSKGEGSERCGDESIRDGVAVTRGLRFLGEYLSHDITTASKEEKRTLSLLATEYMGLRTGNYQSILYSLL